MACAQILSGIAKDCNSSMGGIRRVLLANFDDVTVKTVTLDQITAITMAPDAVFHEYYFRPGTSSLSKAWQINRENGTKYVQSTLAMVFTRMETAKRIAINALAQAELVAIVEDNNGKFWFLGYDYPLEMSEGGGETGTAIGDRNAYTTTLEDNAMQLPFEVDAAIIPGLLGA